MKKLSSLLLSIGIAALSITGAQANELRIGFVDTNRIFQEINLAKSAQNRLQQEFSKREKQLIDLNNTLKTSSDQFDRDQPTLSDQQKATRQKQLVEMDRDLQRKRREFQEDLNARRNEELEQVRAKANRVIKQFATDEKYDLILQDAVWIAPKHDITDKVIKAINTNAK
jgi:outer membrane protein